MSEQWIVRREDGAAVEGPFYADTDADRRLANIRDRCLAPTISKRRLICPPDLLILTTHEVAERYGIVLSPVFPGAVAGDLRTVLDDVGGLAGDQGAVKRLRVALADRTESGTE